MVTTASTMITTMCTTELMSHGGIARTALSAGTASSSRRSSIFGAAASTMGLLIGTGRFTADNGTGRLDCVMGTGWLAAFSGIGWGAVVAAAAFASGTGRMAGCGPGVGACAGAAGCGFAAGIGR